jgi:hypothetical protein
MGMSLKVEGAEPLHGAHPCKSCPFRQELKDGSFDPDVLEATVGSNLRGGQFVHRCHRTLDSGRENLCVGFLRFVRDHDLPNRLLSVGVRLGVIDYTRISDEVELAPDWETLLCNHEALGGRDER